MRTAIVLALALSSLFWQPTAAEDSPGADASSAVVLWAWERPEDLRFLAAAAGETAPVAVAPLVGTLRLSSAGTEIRGRRQPWAVPAGTEITAVVRIEVEPRHPPALEGAAGDALIGTMLEPMLAWVPENARALQIDFDARVSERAFYALLLRRLRSALPSRHGLEITALASWCVGDPWLAELPIDDAVPMFFRMGPDDAPIRRRLADGRDLALELCRQSVGVSTDEPWPAIGTAGRRLFVFHPRPWSPAAFARVLDQIGGAR